MSKEQVAEIFKKHSNRREAIMRLTLEQLEEPGTIMWFFHGEAGSQANRHDAEALQYREMIESMKASRLSSELQKKYTTLTCWIAVSTVVTAAATLVIAIRTLTGK